MRRIGCRILGWMILAVMLCAAAPAGLAEGYGYIAYTYQDDVLSIAEETKILDGYLEGYLGGGLFLNPRVVVLPASLETVNPYFFYSFGKVQEYRVDAENPFFQTIDGVLFSKDGTRMVLFPTGRGGSYTLPAGTREIGENAFACNTSLRELVLCEGMTSATNVFCKSDYGIYGEPLLRTLRLPASLAEASGYDLGGVWLEEITVDGGNPYFYDEDGVLFSRDGTLVRYPMGRTAEHYDVPQGTKTIGDRAFSNMDALRSVSLPGSVARIGDFAFAWCHYLEAVSLPMALEWIGARAFLDCVHLERMSVPTTVLLGEVPFDNCPLLGREGKLPLPEPNSYGGRMRIDGVLSPENARDMVAMREAPSANANVVARYPSGTTVTILGQKAGFYKVDVRELQKETNPEGYIAMEDMQLTAAYQGLFQPVAGQVREGLGQADLFSGTWVLPAKEDPPKSIPAGERVAASIEGGQWYWIMGPGRWGYVPMNQLKVYAEKIPEGKTYGVVMNSDLRDRLHLRAKPSKSGESLGKFFSGAQVEILGTEGDWYHVHIGWQEGYMMKEFVQIVEVQP